MFNPGDYVVVSGYGVCRVDSVGQLSLSCADRGRDYYTLNPVNDECTIHIPCDSDAGHMRPSDRPCTDLFRKGGEIQPRLALPAGR